MKLLEDRILKDGVILKGDVLKVDGFLNHQIDTELLMKMSEEFNRLFKDEGITKILTVEASGIAIACMTGYVFGVPALFAKKAQSSNLGEDVYTSVVHSYTYDKDYTITISKKYLNENDKVLIVDDFMANGLACHGLIDICKQASAEVKGIGICIEKSFQRGGNQLREEGYRVESLAKIKSMDDHSVKFCI